jgi:hypothetical protein
VLTGLQTDLHIYGKKSQICYLHLITQLAKSPARSDCCMGKYWDWKSLHTPTLIFLPHPEAVKLAASYSLHIPSADLLRK